MKHDIIVIGYTKKNIFLVKIDGKIFEFENEKEAIDYISDLDN